MQLAAFLVKRCDVEGTYQEISSVSFPVCLALPQGAAKSSRVVRQNNCGRIALAITSYEMPLPDFVCLKISASLVRNTSMNGALGFGALGPWGLGALGVAGVCNLQTFCKQYLQGFVGIVDLSTEAFFGLPHRVQVKPKQYLTRSQLAGEYQDLVLFFVNVGPSRDRFACKFLVVVSYLSRSPLRNP